MLFWYKILYVIPILEDEFYDNRKENNFPGLN